jgi:two-component system chemotaxis response regulator CheB
MNNLRPLDRKIRTIVVDDSALMRTVLVRQLNRDDEIEVVGVARDGVEALEQARALTPDVITLDVEMPRMDGLAALEQLMRERPTAVVMVSALTKEGADATIRALELGAIDFVLKPTTRDGVLAVQQLGLELRVKVKVAARATLRPGLTAKRAAKSETPGGWQDKVVVVGSSTGGPRALSTLFSGLPKDFFVPILVVQHMPAGFTNSLARRLDGVSPLPVREACPGDHVMPGLALVAPGGFHMRVNERRSVQLDQTAPECGVRPSINVTLESAASVWGSSTLGVILTGMGVDGTRGAGIVRSAGGEVIAEDEASCVIYGMPKSVAEAGYADVVAPLTQIASEINRRCQLEVAARRATA